MSEVCVDLEVALLLPPSALQGQVLETGSCEVSGLASAVGAPSLMCSLFLRFFLKWRPV